MAENITNRVERRIHELGSDWIGEQGVRLGNLSGVVQVPAAPGKYYARQHNGQVITVVNRAQVPPLFDLHVLVRRNRIQPNVWQISEVLQDYANPADQGLIAHHHEQHEEAGSDRVTLDRKQIKQLSCRVAGTWSVNIFGAPVQTGEGIVFIPNQTIDLSAYVVTTGAKYVSIETDDTGALSVNDGTPFSAPNAATAADIPTPDPGKYPLAYVLFHEGQTELIDNNIRVFLPLPGFRAVSWGEITGTLSDQTDLQAELDAKLEDAPIDGLTYGRKDGAWEEVSSGGSGVGELVMESGVTSPPVPIENSAGDDWIYSS